MKRHVVLEKQIGETPLSCLERYRTQNSELVDTSMAYAGRLDPMASGKLLILIGDECKHQEKYHGLDKEYLFSVLFGIESDTHDVLGRLCTDSTGKSTASLSERVKLNRTAPSGLKENKVVGFPMSYITNSLLGSISLPYPHFSSKTVRGKPLHTWTLENRLDEIDIPKKESTVYELELIKTEAKPRAHVCDEARAKIDTIPPVTDPRKALGNDFRRADIRKDWETIKTDASLPKSYTIAHFRCVASSGTYMRSLASVIAQRLRVKGLAWHIHRTRIGTYDKANQKWVREY